MSSGMISTGSYASFHTVSKPYLSTKKSFLEPSSHLSFNTHFPKSSFYSLKTHSKSIRTTPIKAAAADSVCVNTESFYDLLGIPKNGTLSEIKKAYKQLARKYHPDVSPPGRTEECTKMFIQIQEAYETLSDAKSRAMYDRDMARGPDLHTRLSTTKRSRYNRGLDDTDDWTQIWQSQLTELIRMSKYRDMGSISWGAKMRRQRS
ncbi:chaperone protein dnaJ 20, chloroplastic [Hevea brasiliensis]|uniref:chaperone protein dnaJ 20, chloroplastic n=1 Tax=Hevea brasiliensis TaxID=3981 RepID=UPI000B7854C5|nr:chaperone protein dnaJ 20, chloroplastic [Hevea brasiliensis]